MTAELFTPTVNFILFVSVLGIFLRKPTQAFIVSRRNNLLKQVEESRNQKEAAEKKYAEFETKLINFEVEAKQYLQQTQQESEKLRTKIIHDAQAAAKRIVEEANSSVEAKVQEFKNEIKKQTIREAMEIAEKLIQSKLSSDEQKRIISEYVGKV